MSKDSCGADSHDNCCAPQATTSVELDTHRRNVSKAYAQVARADTAGDELGVSSSCCGVSDDTAVTSLISTRLGYSDQEVAEVPAGSDMGLGCGNPKAIAALQPGEVVVDLGSGGGFDCFLAAREVGEQGSVIGVDMTPDMLSKARGNAVKGEFGNVEFRLGEIEYLPVADATADVIISNCVINLSPDKAQVFREAFRVLKPGGRLAISDVVATTELPEQMRQDEQLISGCIGNASLIAELEDYMSSAGFSDIRIVPKDESREFIKDWVPGKNIQDFVISANIEALKPTGGV